MNLLVALNANVGHAHQLSAYFPLWLVSDFSTTPAWRAIIGVLTALGFAAALLTADAIALAILCRTKRPKSLSPQEAELSARSRTLRNHNLPLVS